MKQINDNKMVASIAIQGKHLQEITYDDYNRVTKIKETIAGEKTFTTENVYDYYGRIINTIYPTGYSIKNEYDQYGNLLKVTDSKENNIWELTELNALGQVTKSKIGEKDIMYDYNDIGLCVGINSDGIISYDYQYYSNGLLEQRTDNLTAQSESFIYDKMNRLTDWTIYLNGQQVGQNSVSYDASNGDLIQKSDIGYEFNYGNSGDNSHRLTSIKGNPSCISDLEQNIEFNAENCVMNISEGAYELSYLYGVDNQRRRAVYEKDSALYLTRYYFSNYEEEVHSDNSIRRVHYIHGGIGLVALYVQNDDNDSLYFCYTDNQYNLLAITDEEGVVMQKFNYDPWGNRRDPENWLNKDERTNFVTSRGFTMHEHLDQFNLINMNGRIYDPTVCRFLSPDPFIQSPNNWLNHDRYGYCLNNPLSYIDPSGNSFFRWLFGGVGVVLDLVKAVPETIIWGLTGFDADNKPDYTAFSDGLAQMGIDLDNKISGNNSSTNTGGKIDADRLAFVDQYSVPYEKQDGDVILSGYPKRQEEQPTDLDCFPTALAYIADYLNYENTRTIKDYVDYCRKNIGGYITLGAPVSSFYSKMNAFLLE